MITILRMNKSGMKYRIEQNESESFSTIHNETLHKSIRVKAETSDINRGWYAWQHLGHHIQNAFDFLNADEREFIKTGLTPEEWNEIFKEKE